MNLIYIIITVLIILLLILLFKKNFFITSKYPKESIAILVETFGKEDFTQNGDIFQLQEKIRIKYNPQNNYEKSIYNIMEVVKHKQEVFCKNNIAKNKPYDETTTFQILANEVIDYSIKKNINLKGSIRLLFLTLNNKVLESILDNKKEEKEFINLFYELLPNFVTKYKKKLAE